MNFCGGREHKSTTLALFILLAPVVRKVDSAIYRINLYPLDSAIESLVFIHWIVIYPVDNAIQLLSDWGLNLNTVL